jgi:acetyl/propionyl-CoA carboxylase alpha subunit
VIRKVLIANRGEIARRIMRTARSLGIRTAVVYSDADRSAQFVPEADEAVRLAGLTAADTYLVGDLVIDAARRVGADAIHPGYGFLSENADFAKACVQAGLTFVGPSPDAIRTMGDKLGAKQMMAAHGVPTLPSATVADGGADELAAAISRVGLPAIIKASAGGGGRGMRVVTEAGEMRLALASARREAQAAFGDPTVFIERYLSPARHIEVQIVADRDGEVATLFERECSIQRRHQKLVEESPSPFVDAALRSRLTAAATQAARAVGYRGVGTVEFVVDRDGEFAFLEMNTRLQVEHPVTELITGLDLVAWQFRIAAGERLGPDVTDARLRGHAIEVRLCAEDPTTGHLPASGTFLLFEVDDTAVRVDSGVTTGSEVSPFYDSMVAKVISWGESRADAIAKLADALERARLHGVTTNRDLLVRTLRSDEFAAGDTTTDFLARLPHLARPRTERAAHRQHAAVAAVAVDHADHAGRAVQSGIPAGWRNNRSGLDHVEFGGEGEPITVRYGCNGSDRRVEVDGTPVDIEVHLVDPDTVEATIDGIRRTFRVAVDPSRVLVDSGMGASTFECIDRFPSPADSGPEGGLTAPMPGRVVRILVAAGQSVEAGEPMMVLEAMKMEHTIFSPTAGTVVALHVDEGDQVERSAVLAAVEPAVAP